GRPQSHVAYWNFGYSDLVDIAFPCFNGGVGEFFFQPLNGGTVTLNSLNLGSWLSNGITGPSRIYNVALYDVNFGLLSSYTGIVDNRVLLNIGVSSSTGIRLQFGTDWDVGIDN